MNTHRRLRAQRIRNRLKHSNKENLPRLSVFRSHRWIYAQIINDANGRTLAAASSKRLASHNPPVKKAAEVGALLADKAKKAGVSRVIFDRGGYAYHGQVKALAEGARTNGLIF